jgi:NTE family protein
MFLAGCSSYGRIENKPISRIAPTDAYSIKNIFETKKHSDDVSLSLAFSGGGSRAAAFAYGVLLELRDTTITLNGKPRRLLDEIDVISSVSGGSFTSAYYGLYGEEIFENFENDFLHRDIQTSLIDGVMNPLHWFSKSGRTDLAVKYYEDTIFHGKKFKDMQRDGAPLIVINATDIGYGVRFSFLQEYFDLLCSDINEFPVARAVTASSAVPVLFNPVVLKNHSECKSGYPDWLMMSEKRLKNDIELSQVVAGLKSYFDYETREYVHFLDGGVSDNLGLRANYEIIEIAGGAKEVLKKLGKKPPHDVIIISVNASTNAKSAMDKTNKSPSMSEIINAMSDTQLHRYNNDTLKLMQVTTRKWAQQLSTPEMPVRNHFIEVTFTDIVEPETLNFINNIPTSFRLDNEQINTLISAGRQLLRNNPDFQAFLNNFN